MIRRLASLHWLQRGEVRQLQRYYQDAMTPCMPSRRTSFPSLGGTSVSLVVFAPWQTSEPPRPGVGNPVSPAGNSPRSEQGSPKFLGNLNCPFAHVPIRRRQDCLHQTIAVQQRGPWYQMAKAPTKGLSTLNSMAFGLAVYASQCGYPNATQDSLPVAGQALLDGILTRKVPMKGFKVVIYISFPFPKLSWRNRCI